ncbi:MAG: hypothetical protein NVS4B12_16770 [Ktedonobacteraceae bacterium]
MKVVIRIVVNWMSIRSVLHVTCDAINTQAGANVSMMTVDPLILFDWQKRIQYGLMAVESTDILWN